MDHLSFQRDTRKIPFVINIDQFLILTPMSSPPVSGEVLVVAASGMGHLNPMIALCHHLSSSPLNLNPTLVLPSTLLPSLPSSFHFNTLAFTPVPFSAYLDHDHPARLHLEHHLASSSSLSPPCAAIVDFPMAWTKQVFWKYQIPVIGFFTFGACAAAMEHGAWKARVGEMLRGGRRSIVGLPPEMSLTWSEIQRYPRGSGVGPRLGERPPWGAMIEEAVGLMFNTCTDLERPFVEYVGKELGLPVWAVGPMLPERFWAATASGSLIRDTEARGQDRNFSVSDEDLIQWLDAKTRGSVLFVSFGSSVGPTAEEYNELALALKESTRPYIWVLQPGLGHGLDPTRVGHLDKGLVIDGWVPQLLILSHPSTGGFLSHCGWNSTVEAIGLGVPILGWPIRGDQHLNAKLVVAHLRVGLMASERGPGEMVRKEDLVEGIEWLMSDEEVKRRAVEVKGMFGDGFPRSSRAALEDFGEFLKTYKDQNLETLVSS